MFLATHGLHQGKTNYFTLLENAVENASDFFYFC